MHYSNASPHSELKLSGYLQSLDAKFTDRYRPLVNYAKIQNTRTSIIMR